MIGEILGGHLRRRGAVGLICDGAVRDVGTPGQWTDFPVFTRHITPRGLLSAEHGAINARVLFGGQRIGPGDLLMGDDDGLVALDAEALRSLIGDAEAKLRREAEWQESLAAGRSMAETFGLVEPTVTLPPPREAP
jgi:regulator of RNase E activity RraA